MIGLSLVDDEELDQFERNASLPTSDVILKDFEEYLEAMFPLCDKDESHLRQMDVGDKFNLLHNQRAKAPTCPVWEHAEKLGRHIGLHRRKFSLRKPSKQGIQPLSQLLDKLKMDLKMSLESFILEFVHTPHNGVWLLTDILREIHRDQTAIGSTTKCKIDKFRQCLLDEYDCLLCLKFATKLEEGLTKLVRCVGAVEAITLCLTSNFNKTRVVALQLLCAVCSMPGGFYQVMDAMTALRMNFGETVRFKMLVNMFNAKDSVQFQAVCLRLFNRLWGCTDNSNAKVFLQYELELAGLDISTLNDNELKSDPNYTDLQNEIEIWQYNYINVSDTKQQAYHLESRNRSLTEEIDRQQRFIKEFEQSHALGEEEKSKWQQQCMNYRERAAELQYKLSQLTYNYEQAEKSSSADIKDRPTTANMLQDTNHNNTGLMNRMRRLDSYDNEPVQRSEVNVDHMAPNDAYDNGSGQVPEFNMDGMRPMGAYINGSGQMSEVNLDPTRLIDVYNNGSDQIPGVKMDDMRPNYDYNNGSGQMSEANMHHMPMEPMDADNNGSGQMSEANMHHMPMGQMDAYNNGSGQMPEFTMDGMRPIVAYNNGSGQMSEVTTDHMEPIEVYNGSGQLPEVNMAQRPHYNPSRQLSDVNMATVERSIDTYNHEQIPNSNMVIGNGISNGYNGQPEYSMDHRDRPFDTCNDEDESVPRPIINMYRPMSTFNYEPSEETHVNQPFDMAAVHRPVVDEIKEKIADRCRALDEGADVSSTTTPCSSLSSLHPEHDFIQPLSAVDVRSTRSSMSRQNPPTPVSSVRSQEVPSRKSSILKHVPTLSIPTMPTIPSDDDVFSELQTSHLEENGVEQRATSPSLVSSPTLVAAMNAANLTTPPAPVSIMKKPLPPPLPVDGVPPPAPRLPEHLGSQQTKVNLPLLHWTPLTSVQQTVFQNMDTDRTVGDIDLDDFARQFELNARNEIGAQQAKREKSLDAKISFIEANRAKNMMIMKRSTGLSADQITQAIEQCQMGVLPAQTAELLLKYIPTQHELRSLSNNVNQYDQLEEAEQFLFQMAQVERLESKLGVMSFMITFDDIVTNITPQMQSLYQSSVSLASSDKLKQILQIILAFGNHMNSQRQGYSAGFKLCSLAKLTDVRSKDRTKTLLEHLVEVIATKHPHLSHFYDELKLTVDKAVSYQSLESDVHSLRKGLQLVKYEREKQPDNSVIKNFLALAIERIDSIDELFYKMEVSYQAACSLYGEDYKLIEPGDFFRYITGFIENIKRIQEKPEMKKMTEEAKPACTIPTGRRSVKELAMEAMKLTNERAATGTSVKEQAKAVVNCTDGVKKTSVKDANSVTTERVLPTCDILEESTCESSVFTTVKDLTSGEAGDQHLVPSRIVAEHCQRIESVSSRHPSPVCQENVTEATRNWLNSHPTPVTKYVSITSVQDTGSSPAQPVRRYQPRVQRANNSPLVKTARGDVNKGFVAGFLPYNGKPGNQNNWNRSGPSQRVNQSGLVDNRRSPSEVRIALNHQRLASTQQGTKVAPGGKPAGRLTAIKEERQSTIVRCGSNLRNRIEHTGVGFRQRYIQNAQK